MSAVISACVLAEGRTGITPFPGCLSWQNLDMIIAGFAAVVNVRAQRRMHRKVLAKKRDT